MASKKTTTRQASRPTSRRSKSGVISNSSSGRPFFNSELISRSMLQARLGLQFYGDRDLYAAFGYVVMPTYIDYRAHYDRQGIATRCVEIFADDTWANPPIIFDGDSSSEMEDAKLTPFLKEFNALAKRLGVWQMFRQADIMCGIGRYSVLFMGAPGDYSMPADPGGLFYLAAFDESQTIISGWVQDNHSELYGMPEKYAINFNAINNGVLAVPESGANVHFSRVLHISENRLGSRVYGRPRLQTVLNRLFDLEKVTGGVSEAVWLSIYKGLIITGQEGASLPSEDSPEGRYLMEQIQAYVHKLQRYLVVDNAKVEHVPSDDVKSKEIYDTLISDLAGSLGIPQRILLGSERGNLASSQDMRYWNGVIRNRRTNFAEPEIVDPFIKWCIGHNVIPAPKAGKYSLDWKPVYELNELEQADVALKIAQGAAALTSAASMGEDVVTGDEFRGLVNLPPKNVTPASEEESQDLGQREEEFATELPMGGGRTG